jgi:hypothetical protein
MKKVNRPLICRKFVPDICKELHGQNPSSPCYSAKINQNFMQMHMWQIKRSGQLHSRIDPDHITNLSTDQSENGPKRRSKSPIGCIQFKVNQASPIQSHVSDSDRWIDLWLVSTAVISATFHSFDILFNLFFSKLNGGSPSLLLLIK